MKVPISWLKDYVDITVPLEDLAERLTLAGSGGGCHRAYRRLVGSGEDRGG